MTMERLSRAEFDRRASGLVLDDLDDVDVLVIDDLTREDDDSLRWVRRAPCVVVAAIDEGTRPPASVDVVLPGADARRLDDVISGVEASPRAARVLVDVLRIVPMLPVPEALVVESLGYSTLLASGGFRAWLAGQPDRAPAPDENEPVRIERRDRVLRITLARPGTRNAVDAAMRDALVAALVPAEADDTIERIEIRGDGPDFCSGGDLREFGTAADAARAHEIRVLRSVGAMIDRLRGRVHAHVHGACVGAGVELPAFAGNLHSSSDATFRLPEVSMGLIPGAGGTVSIGRRIGSQRCAELALSGREMHAAEAEAIGLVDRVY